MWRRGTGTSLGDPYEQWGLAACLHSPLWVWGSEPLFWREGDSQRGDLGFKGARKERRTFWETAWSSFGSIIDLMSKSHAGTESRHLQSTDPTSSHTVQPSASLLSAHKGPWCLPHFLPVCTQGGPGTGHSHNLNRRAQMSPAWFACPGTGSGREIGPLGGVCRELPPSPGPAGVEACGSSFFPHCLGQMREGLWPPCGSICPPWGEGRVGSMRVTGSGGHLTGGGAGDEGEVGQGGGKRGSYCPGNGP